MNTVELPTGSPYRDRIHDDPVFNPALHLSLGQPDDVLTLAGLGDDEARVTTPPSVAATSCFRVLSDEGVEALHHVCRQLERFATSNPRIARNVRGGVYRSGFLRDLALSPDVTTHLSELRRPRSPRTACRTSSRT